MNRIRARRRWLVVALFSALVLGGCAGGHPPPGPIDLIREAIDPDYDYRYADRDDWKGRDGRYACSPRDLACSHEGQTVCCSRSDGCCAGDDGPYCCSRGHARGDDRSWDRGWD
jgi:hypothetical protein